MSETPFTIRSPSGVVRSGYTRKDALYAAAVLAENERRFEGRHEPVAVFEATKQIAAVWANAQENWG
jgi:hypothetical protein